MTTRLFKETCCTLPRSSGSPLFPISSSRVVESSGCLELAATYMASRVVNNELVSKLASHG